MSAKVAVRACRAIALTIAAFAFGISQARAAGHVAQTTMQVQATVKPSVVLRLQDAPAQVTVSQADIARGYVDLPQSSLLSVDAGLLKPVLMVDFSPSGSVFAAVEVRTAELASVSRRASGGGASPGDVAEELNALPATGLGRPSGPGAPGVEQDLKTLSSVQDIARIVAAQESGNTTLISYRFRLASGVRPGRYPVPMIINVGL
jgi:hypothetical protein